MNTPTLEQQIETVHPEFVTPLNPSPIEILESNIQHCKELINKAWAASEPNLGIILFLEFDLVRMETKLSTLNN